MIKTLLMCLVLSALCAGNSLASYPQMCKSKLQSRFQQVPSDMMIYCNTIKNTHQYRCVQVLADGYQSMPKDWVLHCANCDTSACASRIESVPREYRTLTTQTLAIIIARANN